jgi:predicted DNA-binding transcriptional regulator AlpA
MTTFLRLPEVMKRTGLARSTIYEHIRRGTFPPQIKLGVKCSGWKESDIEQWAAEQEQASEGREAQAA